MSDFKFACPKCGQNIACDTSNAGMQIACPACQTPLTVPNPPAPAGPMSGAPGKLSINKAAAGHHAPPPPQQKTVPAPGHGTISAHRQPAPAAPMKNKKAIIWGSVIGGVLLIALVAWFGFIAPAQERAAKAKEEQHKQEEAARQAEEKQKRAEEAAKPKEMPVSWTMDLSRSTFPDRPVSGTVNGQPFTADSVTFVSGVLTLRQSSGLISQFVISPVRPAETNSYEVTQDSIGGIPHVVLNWKAAPKPGLETFNKGYVMKLVFNPSSADKVSGKIYLCLPDDAQSYVAGNFEVGGKAAASATGTAAKAATAHKPRKH